MELRYDYSKCIKIRRIWKGIGWFARTYPPSNLDLERSECETAGTFWGGK